jgi:nitrogen fixation/metabolism regulation signal transduction histidine kinase
MQIFIFWTIIIALILGIYIWRLYRHSPRGFRFQVKLSIIFLLLVLIPAIPLTFFVSDLLTRGVEMFLLPGMEKSLSQSLDVIKFQLEDKGDHFFKTYPNPKTMNENILNNLDIAYCAAFKIEGQTQNLLHLLGSEAKLFNQSPSQTNMMISSIKRQEIKSNLFSTDSKYVCEVYQVTNDNIIRIVAFYVDPRIINAKDNISESLRLYNSLSMFKQSVVEGQIIWGLSTVFIILLTLLAVYAAKRLSHGISDPIKNLVSGMQRVATGDLSYRVQPQAKDEIKFLIESFNKMTDDLKNSQEKLVQAERLAAWQGVARRVSHEIKNTLTPIQLSLRRLSNQLYPENENIRDEALITIQEEVESLKRLAEEFTQFARMPQMSPQKENLNEIIQSLVTLIEAEPHGVSIKLDLDPNFPFLNLDRDHIRRALHNLIKNSIEASKPGSSISIETKQLFSDERKGKIEIRDHGTGMKPDVLAKIFEPYFTTKQRGMGLGLSIVKRIIEDHNGKIEIKSSYGKGTQVTIYL